MSPFTPEYSGLFAPDHPAPTLFLLAMAGEATLCTEPYCRVGLLLRARGWNVISLDLPCHGADRRPGEPAELAGWAARIRSGEDPVSGFCARAGAVAEHLVRTGVADPARLAVAGTSRGGFLAFHLAAANPLFGAVAAFAPVTDLAALREFAGLEQNPLVQSLALSNTVEKLSGRAAWITIGNRDERVGTDRCAAFAGALKQEASNRGQASRICFCLSSIPGHASHPDWHVEAAAWLLSFMPAKP